MDISKRKGETKMRVLFVWFTAVISLFVITIGWYICNGVVVTIAHQALADVTGQALALTILLEYVAAWWGPLFDVIILFWAIMSSQEIDPFGYKR
jgi:hypothetical protein